MLEAKQHVIKRVPYKHVLKNPMIGFVWNSQLRKQQFHENEATLPQTYVKDTPFVQQQQQLTMFVPYFKKHNTNQAT